VIAYVLLSVGTGGVAALIYYVAPAGRGAHRYVVPRRQLRAEIARLEKEANSMVCAVSRSLTDVQAARTERDEAWKALHKAELLVADLEKQVADRDEVREENTRLRAELANAQAVRQLSAGPLPPDDTSALPDDVQEFVNSTTPAWRASA
jgi:hypothetical protein